MSIGTNISTALAVTHPGKSIAQMAREIGVNSLTLRNAMTGATAKPSHTTLTAIAKYCDVSVSTLVNGADVPAPASSGGLGDYRDGFRDGYAKGFSDAEARNAQFARPAESAPALN